MMDTMELKDEFLSRIFGRTSCEIDTERRRDDSRYDPGQKDKKYPGRNREYLPSDQLNQERQ